MAAIDSAKGEMAQIGEQIIQETGQQVSRGQGSETVDGALAGMNKLDLTKLNANLDEKLAKDPMG